MRPWLVAIIIFYLASSCVTTLRPDPVMPAIEASYPTAEFVACGKRWHGLGVCSLPRGSKLDALAFGVEVYHAGTLTIHSKDCQLDLAQTYEKPGLVPVPLTGETGHNCLITITISVKYPTQEESDVRVSPLRGHLALRFLDTEGGEWLGVTRKLAPPYQNNVRLWVGGTKPARLVVSGCGRDAPYDRIKKVEAGYLSFALAEVLTAAATPPSVCILEGFVASQYPLLLFNVALALYDARFVPLPLPHTELEGGKLTVAADASVSTTAFNDDIRFGPSATFENFDGTKAHVLRVFTVGGRSAIGEWHAGAKEWTWTN